jgi:hypothetical protein
MALIPGGGGSPNVVGGGTASTGTNVNYVGDHVYAYSGVFQFDNTAFKAGITFTTGANYQVVNIVWGYPENSGDNILSQIYMNSELIFSQYHNNTRLDFTGPPMSVDILVPPFTKLEVGALNGDGNQREALVAYSGRVYA